MPIYNVPCLLQIMDVNGDGTDDLDEIKLRSLEYGQNQATCIPLYFQKNNKIMQRHHLLIHVHIIQSF
jgi:hypothetical protein